MLPILFVGNTPTLQGYVEELKEKLTIPSSHVFYLAPEEKQWTIDALRGIDSYLVAQDPQKKLIVIEQFEQVAVGAQQVLLKLLEEGQRKAQFVLQTATLESVIETIRSRCTVVKGNEADLKHLKPLQEDLKGLMASLAEQPLGKGFFKATSREEAIDKCDALLVELRAYARGQKEALFIGGLINHTLLTKNLLVYNNLNGQTALDSVLLYIKKYAGKRAS